MTSSSLRRPLLASLAALFAFATAVYTVLWMYNNRWQVPVELGFENEYLQSDRSQFIRSVKKASPAEHAGLRPGDRIIAINGRPMENSLSMLYVWATHHPGDSIELSVKRSGLSSPLILRAIFRSAPSASTEGGVAQSVGQNIANSYPVGFLVVGLTVLFLRLEDPNAWLLALMFAGFIAIPAPRSAFAGVQTPLRSFALIYRGIFDNMVAPFFYFFFAVFPTRSPVDRRLPWLKWVALVGGTCIALHAALGMSVKIPHVFILCFLYGLIVVGFASLIGNAIGITTSDARRKIRVILWGTVVSVVPATLLLGAEDFLGFREPFLLDVASVILLWIFPLSFAYAVVKLRVLEIPVLLRRSARYLLVQRGFTILLSIVSIGVTCIFALSFARYLEPLTGAAVPGGIVLGSVFGSGMLWAGVRVHERVRRRIDQAFFRSAYDARVILEDLADKTRTATDRKQLAELLDRHLNEAVQPTSLAVYLESSDDQISATLGNVPPELETIPAPAITAQLARPNNTDANTLNVLAPLRPDYLVPILGRDSRLTGLLVLGERLCEEPYSRDDKQLLTSVASQAGIALESIRLGEKIAERIEAERRIAQEMEYAKQVQLRLFPQKLPVMKTLDYTGACIQARDVGGDYYDFLELRPGRLALALADVAGKGISGALLMANLQANLRSQYSAALDDPQHLLESVNRLFYENSSNSSYATLFFADYDDSTRRLRYVNCGHLPPLLVRADGHIDRLNSTATVLGLFEQWQCSVEELAVEFGDILVLYTDGVTEAENAEGDEFGEGRLIETLLPYQDLPVAFLLEKIVATVTNFSNGQQADDITLVIARCVA